MLMLQIWIFLMCAVADRSTELLLPKNVCLEKRRGGKAVSAKMSPRVCASILFFFCICHLLCELRGKGDEASPEGVNARRCSGFSRAKKIVQPTYRNASAALLSRKSVLVMRRWSHRR